MTVYAAVETISESKILRRHFVFRIWHHFDDEGAYVVAVRKAANLVDSRLLVGPVSRIPQEEHLYKPSTGHGLCPAARLLVQPLPPLPRSRWW